MEKRARGRPRTFDTEAVLEQIKELFWRKGFDGTSLDDIANTTGVARPSLAAAFGDKESMYLHVMDGFVARVAEMFTSTTEGKGSLQERLFRFYSRLIDLYTEDQDQPNGCFLFTTAVVLAPQMPRIRANLAARLKALDEALTQLFIDARARDELPEHSDPRALAFLAAGLQQTLSIRARAGLGRTSLKRLARQTVRELLHAT